MLLPPSWKTGQSSLGTILAAVLSKILQQIQATDTALAAILADGAVITWGNPDDGGDSSAVQNQLRNVQQIQSTSAAFAAILADASVVTWGIHCYGGNSSAVKHKLRKVQQIQATDDAFAAVLADVAAITWGKRCTALSSAQHAADSIYKFLRLLQFWQVGTAVSWGDPHFGACSSAVQNQLRKAQEIQSSVDAFAALLEDGTVTAWGDLDGRDIQPILL